MGEITIKIDSREQRPYQFEIPSQVGALKCGDYSILGLEDCISIERKSINDLVSSLTSERERFKRMLYRGKSLDHRALIVEASLADIINGNYYSDTNPKSVIESLVAFSIRYNLPVWLAGSREQGQRLTQSLLEKYSKGIERKYLLLSQE